MGSFVREGIRRQERMIYTAPMATDVLLADLAHLPERDELIDRGRLVLVPHALPPAATEEAAALVTEFRAMVGRVGEPQRVATRVRADELVRTADAEEVRPLVGFTAFELLVGELVASQPLTMLCGLELVGDAPDEVLFVHPVRNSDAAALAEVPVLPTLFASGERSWVLAGDVDLATRPSLGLALAALTTRVALGRGATNHLDLSALTFMDVGGARCLVELAQALRPTGRLVLHHEPEWLAQLIRNCWGDVPGLAVTGEG